MNPFQLRNWRSGTNWHFKGNFWLWKEKKLDFAWSEFGHCSSLELKLWKVKFLRVATGVKDSKTQKKGFDCRGSLFHKNVVPIFKLQSLKIKAQWMQWMWTDLLDIPISSAGQ